MSTISMESALKDFMSGSKGKIRGGENKVKINNAAKSKGVRLPIRNDEGEMIKEECLPSSCS